MISYLYINKFINTSKKNPLLILYRFVHVDKAFFVCYDAFASKKPHKRRLYMEKKYPKKVQKYIDFLDKFYKEDDTLDTFNVFHLYPREVAYPNGFYDSRFFELIGFNFDLAKKKNLGVHDGMDIIPVNSPQVSMIRIFADGSTLIRFNELVKVDNCSNVYIRRS